MRKSEHLGPPRNRSAVAAVVALVLAGIAVVPLPLQAAEPVCQTSSPASSAYWVTVCLTEPLAPVTLSGRTSVKATVTRSAEAPSISMVTFRVGGAYELSDLEAPYEFTLSSNRHVDGLKPISAEALMSDNFVSSRASSDVTFLNGVVAPPVNGNTFQPRTGTPAPSGKPFTVAAVGDSAAGKAADRAVSDLVASWNPNLFLYLADVYENGSYAELENYYGTGDNYLSRLRSVTNPTVGNHEYGTPNAAGYFDYWDNVPHYYSVDTAGWQIITIDSTSDFDQREPGTQQFEWLKQELQTDPNPCKLVYYHHPRFSLSHGDYLGVDDVWRLMANNGVDVVLNGHDHNYQRWVPMDSNGAPSSTGMIQFVVGTGGKSVYAFHHPDSRLAKGFDKAPNAHGALRLDLGSAGLGYRYINVNGERLDHGSIPCTPGAVDTTSPIAPTDVNADYASGRVGLTWSEATDDVGITGYDVYRDDSLVASLGPQASYFDAQVAQETTYSYTVVARDAAGNVSAPGGPASITTPPGVPPDFQDDFNHGNMSRWTLNNNLVVQSSEVYEGMAARATSSGTSAFARKTLGTPRSDIYYATRFKVVSQAADFVYVQRLKNSTGGVVAGLFITKLGEIGLRNGVLGLSFKSAQGLVTPGWHDLQIHAKAEGAQSRTEVWLDGAPVAALSRSESLGTSSVTAVELGESSLRTYDFVYDDAEVARSFITRQPPPPPPPPVEDTTPPDAPGGLLATATGSDRVHLGWQPATDNVAVTGYEIYRDGSILTSVGSVTAYDDLSVTAGSTHEYAIKAVDAAGNVSEPSNVSSVTVPATLFFDDFESGTLSKWTSTKGATVQDIHVRSGGLGARVTFSGGTGFARKNLGSNFNELYVSLPFKVVAKGTNTMYLTKLRNTAGTSIGGVLLDGKDRLGWRSEASGVTRKGTQVVSKGVWHDLQFHVIVSGASSLTEVWLDGVKVDALTRNDSLGTAGVRTFQMGESGSGHDAAFDDVTVDTSSISP